MSILFWDNPAPGLAVTAPQSQWIVRLAKSIYDDEYRKFIGMLKSERLAAGLTQQQVADRLGRPQSFVAKVEGFERRLDVVEFVNLCRALGVDPAMFFGSR